MYFEHCLGYKFSLCMIRLRVLAIQLLGGPRGETMCTWKPYSNCKLVRLTSFGSMPMFNAGGVDTLVRLTMYNNDIFDKMQAMVVLPPNLNCSSARVTWLFNPRFLVLHFLSFHQVSYLLHSTPSHPSPSLGIINSLALNKDTGIITISVSN